jgi:hypothetical protein
VWLIYPSPYGQCFSLLFYPSRLKGVEHNEMGCIGTVIRGIGQIGLVGFDLVRQLQLGWERSWGIGEPSGSREDIEMADLEASDSGTPPPQYHVSFPKQFLISF